MELAGWAELGWQAWLTAGVIALVFAALLATEAATDGAFTGAVTILMVSGVLLRRSPPPSAK